MRRLNPSIRTQLLCWLLIPLLVLLVLDCLLTYGLAIKLATGAYDQSLLDSVYSVASCLDVKNGKIVADLPPTALAILKENIVDSTWYQVLDVHGNLIAGDQALPKPEKNIAKDDAKADYRDGVIAGEQVRIATVTIPVQGHPGYFACIQVAETLHSRAQIAEEILIGGVVPQFLMVGLSALSVWFGVTRGLGPLRRLRDQVAARTPLDLSPISEVNAPKEVRPLVRAINDLLGRLKEDIQAQRRFVANAAHQLRTPIAGLKTQTELALREKDPDELNHALSLIHISSERASRLTNQLLALAKAEPGARDTELWRLTDLNSIAGDATKEFVSQALAKHIDIGVERAAARCLVRGDASSLHELTSNLIENAVIYTQPGGKVTVKTAIIGSTAVLAVEDNGPGIPEEERGHVFERFYRLSSNRQGLAPGSGLGLAIVREIANSHGAEILISEGLDGMGTSISVVFPSPKRAENMKRAIEGIIADGALNAQEAIRTL